MQQFQQLIDDLGQLTELDLYVDKNGVCQLIIDEKFSLQLTLDSSERHLYIIAPIAELPPGTFRQQALKEAMKENHTTKALDGILSFVLRENLLVLHTNLLVEAFSASELADILEVMIEKGEIWYDALERGSAGPNPTTPAPKDKPPPFGMKL